MSTPLTSKQRAKLRSLGHKLKPLVHVGKEGVSKTLIESVEQTLVRRELIKIRVQEHAPGSPREMANEIAKAIADLHVVSVVGYTAILYRPHPDNPEIRLPQPRKASQ